MMSLVDTSLASFVACDHQYVEGSTWKIQDALGLCFAQSQYDPAAC